MALRPIYSYPSQVDSDAAYPLGKARNETILGDKTGTPLERGWINDQWGFQQALLAEGSITASGYPDTASSSQYLDALKAVIDARADDRINAICITNYPIPLVLQYNAGSPQAWGYADPTTGSAAVIVQTNVATRTGIIQIPNFFAGAAVFANSLHVYLKGASGHGGLPTTMPRVRLFETSNPTAGEPTPTVIADAYDSAGSVGAYEAYHDIQPTFPQTTLTALKSYFLKLEGEGGTNSIVGLEIFAITWSLTLV